MDYLTLWNEYSSYFAAAFKAGLGDSVNPCVLASVLIFVIYCSLLGTSKRRIFFLGLVYIYSSVRMQETIVAGFWDGLLMNPFAQRVISFIYILLAVGFSALGALHFLEWRAHRFDAGTYRRLSVPVFLQAAKEVAMRSRARNVVLIIVIAILTLLGGALFTLFAAIFPQAEFIYIVHSFWASGGDKKLVLGMFFYYSLAMAVPVMAAWAVLMLGTSFFKGKVNILTFYNGVMAALFSSGGLGLGYFVLHNLLGLLT